MKSRPDKELVVQRQSRTLADVRPDLAQEADDFAAASLSKNSRKALRDDWKTFSEWCAAHGLPAMPASTDTAAGFLADQARTKKVATLLRYRASIGKLHKLRGYPSPFADARVKAVLEGIRRKKGVAQTQKKPITLALIEALEDAHVRDRAVLLFGLATSFRGHELCSLNIDDLEWVDEGIVAHLRRSKTDQAGVGRSVGVPRLDNAPVLCPVRAVRTWLDYMSCAGRQTGPLFVGLKRNRKPSNRRLTRGTVNTIVKAAIVSVGLDASEFGAHSLRAGFVTEARKAGLDWTMIMEQTGHKRLETVKRYDRGTIDPFKAVRVADVFEAAFFSDPRYSSSKETCDAFVAAFKAGGVKVQKVGLPPPSRDPNVLSQFTGKSREHQELCSSAALWLEKQGKKWWSRPGHCQSAGGVADVVAQDGSVYVEAGATNVDKVVACLRANQPVMLVPYYFGGVVGFLLSGDVPETEEENRRWREVFEKMPSPEDLVAREEAAKKGKKQK